MKISEKIHQNFILLCIYPNRDPTSRWIKSRNLLILTLNLFLMFGSISSSLVFIKMYFNIDLARSLVAAYQIGATGPVGYTLSAGFLLRKDIAKIFDDIQTIYDLCKFSQS